MAKQAKYTADGKKVFIRYPNRKLYDTVESKYINVAVVAKLPLGTFVVLDNTTKEDITTDVLLSALNTFFSNNITQFETVKEELVKRFLQN